MRKLPILPLRIVLLQRNKQSRYGILFFFLFIISCKRIPKNVKVKEVTAVVGPLALASAGKQVKVVHLYHGSISVYIWPIIWGIRLILSLLLAMLGPVNACEQVVIGVKKF